jgi:glycyl-tRNA synthetase beta chain
MPELVLELFSEEIPARMQGRAAADLQRLVNERLLAAGFLPEGVKAFAGPRRLSLVASGLPARQPDRKEEKKGPRVGAPEKAVEGFLKSAGLSSLDACEVRDDRKGQFYVALIEEKGRETSAVIAGFLPEVIAAFPWPKSMRWGDGELRWVRPLHSILCCFDGEVVSFEVDGVRSGDTTRGHRFMAPGEIRARNFDKYFAELKRAHVLLDAEERKTLIAGEAKSLCEAQGLELVDDGGLLNEVSGLAEWPVVMIGTFDEKFLTLPDEVLTATMRGHQKYFSVKNPKTGRLANKFVFVANLEAPDGGAAMRAGYERVLTARLSDAWYLYRQDLKVPLEDRIKDLDRVTFFEGLGSVGDKARRVAALAREIAPAVGADPELAEQAAMLAKADLVTGMVYEFPELQGVMGRYYFLEQGGLSSPARGGGGREATGGGPLSHAARDSSPVNGGAKEARAIADAIRDHYKPAGAEDEVPTAPVSVAVALADKIDTLTAFWAIGKKPTGSSDPFALRRAALGFIATISEGGIRINVRDAIIIHAAVTLSGKGTLAAESFESLNGEYDRIKAAFAGRRDKSAEFTQFYESKIAESIPVANELVSFFHDRLKVYLREKGHRYDAIDAVLAKAYGAPEDDLVLIVRKLEALEAFLKTDDGANLASGYKRAANILKAEEKKEGVGRASARHADAPHAPSWRAEARPTIEESLFRQAEEKALYAALEAAEEKARKAVADEKFEDAMAALSTLRAPIDAFFDAVTVNADDKALRANRLTLLARFRAATAAVADLSKLEG